MGKTIEDLTESRKKREEVIRKFGEVPTSVWNIDYNWGKSTIELDSRKQQKAAILKHKKMDYNIKSYVGADGKTVEYNEMLDAFSMSSQNVRGLEKGSGLSTFPPDLCRKIVTFYSEEGDTILDPTCGHNSRMEVCHKMNRMYIGYDICSEFMEHNRKVKEILTTGQLFESPYTITLREQTSEKMVEDSNSIDLVMTSPPYYKIEHYDDNPLQLGLRGSYQDFLNALKTIISECYRVLKPNKYCVFNVNDFRMDNKYHMYHADTARLMEQVGFKLHDIIIVPWQSCIGACFADQVWSRKVSAKKHEYLIVSKKIIT